MESRRAIDAVEPVVERLTIGPFGTNCYIVRDPATAETVIIDPAADADLIASKVAPFKPRMILLTHGHIDHVGAVRALKSMLGLRVGLFPLDAGLAQITPDVPLKEGEPVSVGQFRVTVLHTPGHTPGGVTFVVQKDAFVGDLIFPGGPGATRTPVDFDQILRSITAKILPLPPETKLHPGHGEGFTVARAREEVGDFLHRPSRVRLCGEVHWAES
jgi:hydroxyacylglutathione hydrolase